MDKFGAKHHFRYRPLMKKIVLILILLSQNILGYAQTYNGTIIRVIDGDTFVIQTEEGSLKVRMFGTDAPERDQPYSKESADFLKQYLNKDATLKASGVDRYSRTLGVLYIDGQDINLLSIKNGCSWHFKRYSSNQKYSTAEEYARRNKIGLWALPNPVPPWDWRKK
jgi:endonuclease YncB( thermonuclease family)